MSGLCWAVVTLTLLLSSGNSFPGMTKEQLAKYVKFFMQRYNIHSQVSVAVNIPNTMIEGPLEKVFEKATPEEVRNQLKKSVYPVSNDDTMVVVAKPKFPDEKITYTVHAEEGVLEKIKTLFRSGKDDFLLFYSFNSPCGSKCTNLKNKHNIISKINEILPKWKQFAFVFFKVFDKTSKNVTIKKADSEEALKQLGNSKIGHDNIFRCYKPNNQRFQCINCFSGKDPVEKCLVNES